MDEVGKDNIIEKNIQQEAVIDRGYPRENILITETGRNTGIIMIKVIGVRFRTAGKIYFFDPGELEIKKGQNVIVETARGVEYGYVVMGVREVEEEKVVQPLKAVLRVATEQDDRTEEKNKEKEKAAHRVCLEKIAKHNLDMKLIDTEYTFDNNKVLFY